MHSWGVASMVLEMNFCPLESRYFFSCTFYHSPRSFSSLEEQEVENGCDLFFQEIMLFLKVSFAEF